MPCLRALLAYSTFVFCKGTRVQVCCLLADTVLRTACDQSHSGSSRSSHGLTTCRFVSSGYWWLSCAKLLEGCQVAVSLALSCCSCMLKQGMEAVQILAVRFWKFCGLLQVLNLSPALATGLILVSCCPGGQVGFYTHHPSTHDALSSSFHAMFEILFLT